MFKVPERNRHTRRKFFHWLRLGRNFLRRRNGHVLPLAMHKRRQAVRLLRRAKDTPWFDRFEFWTKTTGPV